MRNIYISALHALLLAIMPTILTSCTQCNAENKGQMKDMQQNRTAGKIVGSYTEETEGIHFTLNGVEFKMVTVEGGTFTMGHNNRQPNEKTGTSGYAIHLLDRRNRSDATALESRHGQQSKP